MSPAVLQVASSLRRTLQRPQLYATGSLCAAATQLSALGLTKSTFKFLSLTQKQIVETARLIFPRSIPISPELAEYLAERFKRVK